MSEAKPFSLSKSSYFFQFALAFKIQVLRVQVTKLLGLSMQRKRRVQVQGRKYWQKCDENAEKNNAVAKTEPLEF